MFEFRNVAIAQQGRTVEPRPALMSKQTLLLAFVLLQLLDVFTTNRVLAAGGFEANPLMADVMARLGSLWWMPKLAIALTCALVLFQGRRRFLAAGVAYMSVAVLINSISLAVAGGM